MGRRGALASAPTRRSSPIPTCSISRSASSARRSCRITSTCIRGSCRPAPIGETLPGAARSPAVRDPRSTIALMFALTINASLLILAAAAFHHTGRTRNRRDRRGAYAPRSPCSAPPSRRPVRHRASVLRPELHRDGHDGGTDRHGRVHQFQAAALAAPPRHARHRDRAGGRRHHRVRRIRHGATSHPEPGGPEPAAALRGGAAGDVDGVEEAKMGPLVAPCGCRSSRASSRPSSWR